MTPEGPVLTISLEPPRGLVPRAAPPAGALAALVANVDTLLAVEAAPVPPPATSIRTMADEIGVIQRQIDRLGAALLQRLAEFDAVGGADQLAGTSTVAWLRHRTGIASGQASDLVRTARMVRDELPATRIALRNGDITTQHARTVAATVRSVADGLPPERRAELVPQVEQVMLEVSRAVDAGSLSGFAARVRHLVDPDGSLADSNRARERRWFTAAQSLDGMVVLDGLLEKESGALLLTALSAGAVPTGPDDQRSAGQRRADALVELCRRALDRGEVAATGGVQPHLLVTATVETLTAAKGATNVEPAQMQWAGPILAESARRIACDATITRVLVDPMGQPLDVGRSTRVVPPAIRHALLIRDRGCAAKCCDRPAAWTEAHHIVHWVHGGSTSLDNLVLLCRNHHRKVHENGWRLVQRTGSWELVPP